MFYFLISNVGMNIKLNIKMVYLPNKKQQFLVSNEFFEYLCFLVFVTTFVKHCICSSADVAFDKLCAYLLDRVLYLDRCLFG